MNFFASSATGQGGKGRASALSHFTSTRSESILILLSILPLSGVVAVLLKQRSPPTRPCAMHRLEQQHRAMLTDLNKQGDCLISAEQAAVFHQDMGNAGTSYRVVAYPGAKHAFTNPDADRYGQEFKLPLAYNAAADKASWDEGLAFLADAFKRK